jgi:DNA mismatch repair ATPase MutS
MIAKKKENNNNMYLFKSGNFYIFLGENAKIMSEELGLKLTKFSTLSNKCGFPVNELNKYLKFIKLLKYE